jgi:hypothetical protein
MTTRILVVGWLSGRVPAGRVAAVVVVNAHRVTEQSGEAFCATLLRDGALFRVGRNPSGAVCVTQRGVGSEGHERVGRGVARGGGGGVNWPPVSPRHGAVGRGVLHDAAARRCVGVQRWKSCES